MTVVERKAQLWDIMQSNIFDGIKRARAKGKHIGRPMLQINDNLLIKFANGNGKERKQISQESGISLTTLYRRLKERRNDV